MSVSRETMERLEVYGQLICEWNPHINLVAHSTIKELRKRHFDDCLQILDLEKFEAGKWVDLGSGAGLPGLILAIALADSQVTFTLVESDQRKGAFLRAVVRETGLKNVTLLCQRIEDVSPLNAAYISARALAPLSQLMPYLDLHLARKGKAFLMKGRQWQSEVDEAKRDWVFDYVPHPSRTQDGAAILEVSGVQHGI